MQKSLQKELLVATNNPGKIIELRALLAELPGIRLVFPQDLGLTLEVAETGGTYAENAALKAAAFAEASERVALADDSGLEVDALNGEPGIRSKRYAPQPGATDADRRAYLLENLAGAPRPWTARFRAVVAVVTPGEAARFAEGVCEGQIIPEERGTNGFGYDPIFFISEKGLTMAELGDAEKNRISHRGRAVAAGMGMIKEVLGVGD